MARRVAITGLPMLANIHSRMRTLFTTQHSKVSSSYGISLSAEPAMNPWVSWDR